MTVFKNVKNGAKSTLASGISNSATSLTVAGGEGAKFPAAEFWATIWDKLTYPDARNDPNAEIVLVTAVATDTFTITRGQEGTAGVSHASGAAIEMLVLEGHFREIHDAIHEDSIIGADAELVVVDNASGLGPGAVLRNTVTPGGYVNMAFPGAFSLYGNTDDDGNGPWDKGMDFTTNDLAVTTPGGGTITVNGTAVGDVAGAASSTDNAIPRFDGTGGKTLQESDVVIDDDNKISGVNTLETPFIKYPDTPPSDISLSAFSASYTGAAGSTTYRYLVIGYDDKDMTTGSGARTWNVFSAASTLNGSNYNTLSWTVGSGTPDHFKVFRIAGTGTYKHIATVASGGTGYVDNDSTTFLSDTGVSNSWLVQMESAYGTIQLASGFIHGSEGYIELNSGDNSGYIGMSSGSGDISISGGYLDIGATTVQLYNSGNMNLINDGNFTVNGDNVEITGGTLFELYADSTNGVTINGDKIAVAANTPVNYSFSGTSNRTRNSATAAAPTGVTGQAFTSKTGRVKVTMTASLSTNTETGNMGVYKSDTSSYTVILSTNNTARNSITGSYFFTVTPNVSVTYTPYFASQSGSSTVTLWPYSTSQMTVEDVL